ncbi:DNA polymerase-3 subunit epsilon/ATP-dependent DNA helicase DinG/DNA polymerase-3 subunit alpha (Gram-positive type) [Paenibacillus methanolicus]|uniref:DNA polymerase-3 subunit epsilon/ATP-dependent DNA helicase DinG/DNA polymerase-3 subunit alpha (Gram-positive type) n=1 Tax=Paenibacillus methanolicus TaxID=582686 RepID=A0A5S5BU88_9BACL|nr:DNA polymerase-3 subunit epsilon/ATP-dependent DNA helicase DinG/DNA polymerase-3 subunit alpha (Gram-positive type) [Paenibacillus methanolicus]
MVHGITVQDLASRTYCVFDLEGTGIDFDRNHITQIGAVRLEAGKIVRTFRAYVRSPRPIPPSIEAMTGISNAMIQEAPAFPEAIRAFRAFCEGSVLATQAGYEYDMPMLERHCREYGVPGLEQPVLDTKAMFAWLYPECEAVISTDYLLDYYHLSREGAQRHDALGDCVLISRILTQLLAEYKERGIADFRLDNSLTVRRFAIPGMART